MPSYFEKKPKCTMANGYGNRTVNFFEKLVMFPDKLAIIKCRLLLSLPAPTADTPSLHDSCIMYGSQLATNTQFSWLWSGLLAHPGSREAEMRNCTLWACSWGNKRWRFHNSQGNEKCFNARVVFKKGNGHLWISGMRKRILFPPLQNCTTKHDRQMYLDKFAFAD